MVNKTKLIIIILTVFILLSLSLASGVFYLFQKEQSKNVSLRDELDTVKFQQKKTEEKLQEYKKLISELELKVQEAEAKITTLNADLQQEKSAKQKILTQVEQLKADLEQQKSLRADLENKLKTTQGDAKKLEAQLKTLDSEKEGLLAKVKELEEKTKKVELGKIVVSPETEVATEETASPSTEKQKENVPATNLEGKVIVVNKDYGFAVINLGGKDGVNMGDIFSVYRSNKYIGDIKLEKIHDSMSAAGFVSEGMKDKVNEGDKVLSKAK